MSLSWAHEAGSSARRKTQTKIYLLARQRMVNYNNLSLHLKHVKMVRVVGIRMVSQKRWDGFKIFTERTKRWTTRTCRTSASLRLPSWCNGLTIPVNRLHIPSWNLEFHSSRSTDTPTSFLTPSVYLGSISPFLPDK